MRAGLPLAECERGEYNPVRGGHGTPPQVRNLPWLPHVALWGIQISNRDNCKTPTKYAQNLIRAVHEMSIVVIVFVCCAATDAALAGSPFPPPHRRLSAPPAGCSARRRRGRPPAATTLSPRRSGIYHGCPMHIYGASNICPDTIPSRQEGKVCAVGWFGLACAEYANSPPPLPYSFLSWTPLAYRWGIHVGSAKLCTHTGPAPAWTKRPGWAPPAPGAACATPLRTRSRAWRRTLRRARTRTSPTPARSPASTTPSPA
eukprot:COSAG05_NODE_1878_length_3911_cov_62.469576_7_plen_259_part_00